MAFERNNTDLELLSAYIDDELTPAERAEVAARLENEPDLRRELASLQGTVSLIRDLPLMPPPRDFTLTPEMVRPPSRWLIFPTSAVFSGVAAAVATLTLILGLFLIFAGDAPNLAPASMESVAQQPTEPHMPQPAEPQLFREESFQQRAPQATAVFTEAALAPDAAIDEIEESDALEAGESRSLEAPPDDSDDALFDMEVMEEAASDLAEAPPDGPEANAVPESALSEDQGFDAIPETMPSAITPMAEDLADEAVPEAEALEEDGALGAASEALSATETPPATAISIVPTTAPPAPEPSFATGGNSRVIGGVLVGLGLLLGIIAVGTTLQRRRAA